MNDIPPQIVYYSAAEAGIKVYCDINKSTQIVTLKRRDELLEAINLLNSVGCNISLRCVEGK